MDSAWNQRASDTNADANPDNRRVSWCRARIRLGLRQRRLGAQAVSCFLYHAPDQADAIEASGVSHVQ